MVHKITNLIFFTFFIINVHCQDTIKKTNVISMTEFISIKIQTGYTIFGTNTLSLQREGLIYWFNPFMIDNPEEAKFIPFNQLDIKKVFEIFSYINDEDLVHFKEQEIPKGTIKPEGNPYLFSFLIIKNNEYKYFYYSICNDKIDTLIIMLNELIPIEDKESFSIIPRCFK